MQRIKKVDLFNFALSIRLYTNNRAIVPVDVDSQCRLILQHRHPKQITEALLGIRVGLFLLFLRRFLSVLSVSIRSILCSVQCGVRYKIHGKVTKHRNRVPAFINIIVFYIIPIAIFMIRPIGTDGLLIDLDTLLPQHRRQRYGPTSIGNPLHFRL